MIQYVILRKYRDLNLNVKIFYIEDECKSLQKF